MAERCRPGTGPRMKLIVQYESGGIFEVFTGDLLGRLLAVIDAEAADRIDAAISGVPRE